MKKILAAALLATAVTTPAIAGDMPLYVGVTLGPSSVGNSSSFAIGGLVGYKLDKSQAPFMGTGYLSIEGQYTMLGTDKYTFFGGSIEAKYASMGVDAVAVFPIPSVKNLSGYGKLGFNSISASITCTGGLFGCSGAAGSTSGLDYGVGVQYDMDKKLAVRAGYQGYASNASAFIASVLYSL